MHRRTSRGIRRYFSGALGVASAMALLALLVTGGCRSSVDVEPQAVAEEAPATAEKESALAELPSPAIGGDEPKVRIFEVSGFQCPFCARGGETMKEVLEKYGDDVQLVFKHNPLGFHQEGFPSAIVSMAAHKQGKFWEMHSLLFSDTRALREEKYREYAREIGLDMELFERHVADPALRSRIERDQGAALALGARGTPAFFINGINISGAQPLEKFVEIIDEEIEKADELLAQGVPRAEVALKATEQNEDTAKLVDFWYRGRRPPPPPAEKPKAEKPEPQKKPKVDTTTVWHLPVRDDDPMKGARDALVTIVEFSNFQCPFCSRVAPTTKRLVEEYGDQVRVVFKHYPLDFHKDAPLAAEASLAAHAQGKFWEMHDLIFEDQKSLSREVFEDYAEQLGLDMERFRRELDEGVHTAHVEGDKQIAQRIEVRGTPSLFVNGRRAAGVSYEDLKPQVEEELKRARALVEAGTPRDELYQSIIKSGRRLLPFERKVVSIDTEGAPSYGPDNAPVTIVKFSEFECPACSRVGAPLKRVVRHYDGRVRLVFKNFPLPRHRDAALAAEAGLAAHAQGRFWDMHDVMFQNRAALGRGDLERYAGMLGLDMRAFKNALDRRRYRAQVAEDIAAGRAAGVRGTPTVFVNGRRYNSQMGGFSADAIIQAIDEHILRTTR